MITFKRLVQTMMKLMLSVNVLPAKSISYQNTDKAPLARIAVSVKNRKLSAFTPSADPNEYNYKWKIFQDGIQIGQTLKGSDIASQLPHGDYNLHLAIERKADHKILSTTSIKVHSS